LFSHGSNFGILKSQDDPLHVLLEFLIHMAEKSMDLGFRVQYRESAGLLRSARNCLLYKRFLVEGDGDADGTVDDDGVELPQPAARIIKSDRLVTAAPQFNIDALKG
jgi:hypothetical protein